MAIPRPDRTHAEHSRGPAARSPHSSRSHSWAPEPPPPGTGSGRRSWGSAARGSSHRRERGSGGPSAQPSRSARSGSRCSCTAGSPAERGLFLQGREQDGETREDNARIKPPEGSSASPPLLQEQVKQNPCTGQTPGDLPTGLYLRRQCRHGDSRDKA